MSINLKNSRFYIERFLKIRTKDAQIIPFELNQPQLKLYNLIKNQAKAEKPIRIIILKARQMGFSTLTEGIIFHRTITKSNVTSLVIAHKDDATSNLFTMTKRFYDNLPDIIRPMKKNSNKKELSFENPTTKEEIKKLNPGLGSVMRCATAGGSGVGRSDTIQNVHASEFAFWPGDKVEILSGIMQAVPDNASSLVIIESTANGFDEFKDLWDTAVEDFKSGNVDGWTPLFVAWHEMDDYRRKVPPDFKRTAEEQELCDIYKLDDEQIAWRRWCIKVNCSGDINKFNQEYPASPEDAFIASGACIFDTKLLILQKERVRDISFMQGRFLYDFDGKQITNIRWQDDESGEIKIYKEPERGMPYVIGGDTSGEGSDYFVGQVIDNITGEQVAVLRHEFDDDFFVHQMYCLGFYFNNALIAIEVNYNTYPVRLIEDIGYRNLYTREVLDDYTGKLKKSYGFRTDTLSRPLIISELREVAQNHTELINDDTTLSEMLSFVKNKKGKAEAENGKHDDCVMALAIAHHARSQMRMTVLEDKEPQRELLIDRLRKSQPRHKKRRF